MITDFGREESLVVELVLHPSHQVVDVLGRRALDRLLDSLAVGPVVLVLGSGRHERTRLLGAELGDSAVKHVDLVEEVNGVDGHPLVDVLALGQHDGQPEVARAQCGRRLTHQVVLVGALRDVLLGLKRLVRAAAAERGEEGERGQRREGGQRKTTH